VSARRDRRFQSVGIQASITQASDSAQIPPAVLRRFQDAVWPVRCQLTKRSSSNRKPSWRPWWVLSFTSFENVQALFCYLWPWLGSVKRNQFLRVRSEMTPPVRAPKGFCVRGHRIEIVGRDGNGGCGECRREYQRMRTRESK